MTAIVTVLVKVKDPEKFSAYTAAAPATVKAHGGEFTNRIRIEEVLDGQLDYPVVVTIAFPNAEAARRWYASSEYQALIPNRDAAADMVFALGAAM